MLEVFELMNAVEMVSSIVADITDDNNASPPDIGRNLPENEAVWRVKMAKAGGAYNETKILVCAFLESNKPSRPMQDDRVAKSPPPEDLELHQRLRQLLKERCPSPRLQLRAHQPVQHM
ncbi:MAG: hypothetical protein Q9217_000032 [Psora testacea]